MQGGGGSRAHVNCASFAQAGHGSHPGNGNALPAAQPAQFASELWVSVLRQKYPQDPACLQGFFNCLIPTTFGYAASSHTGGCSGGFVAFIMSIRKAIILEFLKSQQILQDFFRLTPVVFPIFGRLYLPE